MTCRFRLSAAFAAMVAVVGASAASAHHAVDAEFDLNKTRTVTGVLTQVDWVNPHVYFHFQIKGRDGRYTPWLFQSPSPALLKRAGLPGKESYRVGSTYKIVTNPSRTGANVGTFGVVTFPDGRKLNIGWADPTFRPNT
jgi:hypothetical protein